MNEAKKIDATPKPKAETNEAMSSMEFPRFESPFFMLPSALRAFAENQVTQRKETLGALSTAAQEAYSTSVRGLNECGQKIMGAGHQDADGVYDCCRELMAAKSLPEVVEVWTTHAPRQLNAMSSRTGELWTLYWKVAANAVNGPAPRPNKAGPVRRSSSPKKASVREPTDRSVFSEFNLRTGGYAMNRVNRSLSPGDLDHPICICGRDMRLATVEPHIRQPNTSLHTFECADCRHQLKVMHDDSRAR